MRVFLALVSLGLAFMVYALIKFFREPSIRKYECVSRHGVCR